MCSAFLCAEVGIDAPILDNAAAYVASWLKVLSNDPRLVVVAAGQAQKAADFILNRAPLADLPAETHAQTVAA